MFVLYSYAEDFGMEWRVRAIRGATTASENSVAAIREAVNELLDELEGYNQLDTRLLCFGERKNV